jgi:hypothetical protein
LTRTQILLKLSSRNVVMLKELSVLLASIAPLDLRFVATVL